MTAVSVAENLARPILAASLAVFAWWGLAAAPAAAGDPGWASPWIANEQVRMRLVSAQSALGPDGRARLGLEVHLAPGWSFYWRNPGDNGLAPLLDWSATRNAADIRVDWPAPHRKEVQGAQNIIYSDEVVLPVTIVAADPARPLVADLLLDYGVCKEVCVPYSHRLVLDLPPGAAAPTTGAEIIDFYAGLVPVAAGPDNVTFATAVPRPGHAGLVLRAMAAAPFVAPDLFVEGPEELWFGPPQVSLSEDRRTATFTLPAGPADALRALPGGARLRATLVDTDRAVEGQVAVAAPDD